MSFPIMIPKVQVPHCSQVPQPALALRKVNTTLFTSSHIWPPPKMKPPWSSILSLPFISILLCTSVKVKVVQSCPTLCDPMDYTVHGILQARILEWVAFPFSRGSSQPRDQTRVSHIAGKFFTSWALREALCTLVLPKFPIHLSHPDLSTWP